MNRAKQFSGRTRVGAALAVAAALSAPVGLTATAQAAVLPPGVIKLNDAEACPQATLCLYQHYGRQGPAYGIGAGYDVNLYDLPMGNGTAAKNVSSWINNTGSIAVLLDADDQQMRPLLPGQALEEPLGHNDSVDAVHWMR